MNGKRSALLAVWATCLSISPWAMGCTKDRVIDAKMPAQSLADGPTQGQNRAEHEDDDNAGVSAMAATSEIEVEGSKGEPAESDGRRENDLPMAGSVMATGDLATEDDSAPVQPQPDADTVTTKPADYDLVFAGDRVHSIYITMTSEQYQTLQDNLQEITTGGGFPDLGAQIAACEGLEEGATCMLGDTAGTCQAVQFFGGQRCVNTAQGGEGRAAGGGGALDLLSGDPVEVDVQVRYEDETFEHVGMRYKGNSSLSGSSRMGILKVPFRLDFDEFEEMYPDTHNRKFHGFKDLTFASNYNDPSMLRDTLVSEIMRERGVPAARCAFYRVFVDTGAGDLLAAGKDLRRPSTGEAAACGHAPRFCSPYRDILLRLTCERCVRRSTRQGG